MNSKPLSVGAMCELRIRSGAGAHRVETYLANIIELCAATARVQIMNGGIVRVAISQLRVL